MEGKMYVASCPVCGRALFKGAPHSYIEGSCPKCRKYLQITFSDVGFQARISEQADYAHTN